MLNEGVGHYYSLRPKLSPRPKWVDFAERERRAFELLSKNYPKYLGETDEKRRDKILWRSHAGVPFWEKWSAVPGALIVYRLKSVVGKKGLQSLLAREPFSVFVEYDRHCQKHPRWPKLPKRLVRDARAELNER
jgi:hypothetical protein